MDEKLREAFQQTDYRVSTAPDVHASIRIGQPLPQELLSLLAHADTCWGYITACNPRSQRLSPAANEHGQQQLLTELGGHDPPSRILQGVGVGTGGWQEPSLFVIDVPLQTLDALMRQFDQYAIVHGVGAGPATLHWNPDLTE